MSRFIQRMVNLEKSDYYIVRRLADERGLGLKGFSAALRTIIREWDAFQREGVHRADRPLDVPPRKTAAQLPPFKS